MEPPQIVTVQKNVTPKILAPVAYEDLNHVQRAYVDYKAVSGIVTDDDGIRKMPVEELARQLGCDRKTVYRNRDMVPNFWDLVGARNKQIGNQERLAKMQEVWYLKAIGSGPQAFNYFQLWQANFNPNFRMPTEKIEHDYGNGVLDLISKARKIIDAEVINADPSSTDNA